MLAGKGLNWSVAKTKRISLRYSFVHPECKNINYFHSTEIILHYYSLYDIYGRNFSSRGRTVRVIQAKVLLFK